MNVGICHRPGVRTLLPLVLSLVFLSACSPENGEEGFRVQTLEVTGVEHTSLVVSGSISNPGGEPVRYQGFCWKEVKGPLTFGDSCSRQDMPLQEGIFSDTIRGLRQNTTYRVQAYAQLASGSVCGEELEVTTLQVIGPPVVQTLPPDNISTDRARLGGVVVDNGGSPVSDAGVCWDTVPSPTFEGFSRSTGPGEGEFTTLVEDLELITTYYVRAYAVNGNGLAYGEQFSFRTNGNPVTDIDGNEYTTVAIGEQVWMAENLRVTHFPNGEEVPRIRKPRDWDSLKVYDPAFNYYNDNPGYARLYGALYNWPAAVDIETLTDSTGPIQGVCPDGWHLPSDEEWQELERFMGMSGEEAAREGWRGSHGEGGHLKAPGYGYWYHPNRGADDAYRFSALPAGDLLPNGSFFNMRYNAFFWTSTEYDGDHAWARGLNYYVSTLYRGTQDTKKFGFSVRCVRDD
jgi:uncharacterized protein (TIGR02145 family)